jgi:regulator of RNase E activity RraA
MLTFGPEFERPPAGLIALFQELPVATISDALGPGHVLLARVRALRPGMRIVGPAYTLKLPLADNLGMHVAVRDAQPGDVIIADQQGASQGAPVGEIMAIAAQEKGLAGIVLDGVVRDLDKLSTSDWPVFAAGVFAQQCRKDGPAWMRQPMTCAGVLVRPGDIVVGDDDGVVVVPVERAFAVAAEVVLKVKKEAGRIAAIREGVIFPAWLDEAVARAGIVNT